MKLLDERILKLLKREGDPMPRLRIAKAMHVNPIVALAALRRLALLELVYQVEDRGPWTYTGNDCSRWFDDE